MCTIAEALAENFKQLPIVDMVGTRPEEKDQKRVNNKQYNSTTV